MTTTDTAPALPHIGPISEIADNHQGVPLFSDPKGTSTGLRIPYGTHVDVLCVATNQSGMASINAFYLINTKPWIGLYAPANTFANGDSLDGPGSTALDPKVPLCSGIAGGGLWNSDSNYAGTY